MSQFQKHAVAVRLFAVLARFAARLQDLPNRMTPPPFRLLQIGSALWQSRALYVACRLDIATALGGETLAADAIAARVATHADATFRLLRMLAAMGVFEETAPHTFRNNRLSAFLRTDHPHSVRALILMHNSDEMSRPWTEQLEQGVRGGGVPFALTHGEELFGYMDHHPGFDALFSAAMDSVEALTGDSFATDFDWARFQRVIDVGGSRGSKALAILKRHPHLKALVVDREQVVRDAMQFWAGREEGALLARLEFRAGDILAAVPPATSDQDVYFVSAVLHGFDDASCVRALKNLAAASGNTGARIAVMELVIDEPGADLASASFDMQMFMGTRGRERTLADWTRLARQSGLAIEQVVGLRSFGKILVIKTGA